MEAAFQAIDRLIKSIDQLGALPTSSVFALACVYLGWILYKRDQRDAANSENWRKTREEGIHAETEQTEALKRMAEGLRSLSDGHVVIRADVSKIQTILDERLPRKGS